VLEQSALLLARQIDDTCLLAEVQLEIAKRDVDLDGAASIKVLNQQFADPLTRGLSGAGSAVALEASTDTRGLTDVMSG
jgi:hypothetical protein